MSEDAEEAPEGANDISVHSLAAFLDWVALHQRQVDELNKSLEDDNLLTLYFRGVRSRDYMLIPSVYRQGLIENEDVVFNECLCRNPQDFTGEKTTFDKLVKMQHYGVPTRLLDITTNPLVALYFACEKEDAPKPIGEVYVFYISAKALKYSDSNTVAVASNIAVRPYGEMDIHNAVEQELKSYIKACSEVKSEEGIKQAGALERKVVEAFNERGDVARLVNAIQNEKPGFLPLVRKEHLESVWAVKPKLSNDRIVRQDGAFLLYGILGSKMVPLSIVRMAWAKQCLADVRRMHFLTTILGSYTQDDEKFLSEVQDRYGISPDLLDRYSNKVTNEGDQDHYIGYDVRMYISSEAMAEMMSRVEELWETVEKADFARISDKYFSPLLGSADEWKTRSRISYFQFDSLRHLSMKVALASFMYNACRNEALIFCDSIYIENKTAISKEIAPLGMTRDKLFPELDDVAEYLKEKYKKKDAAK